VVGKGAQEAMTMLVPCNANVWFMWRRRNQRHIETSVHLCLLHLQAFYFIFQSEVWLLNLIDHTLNRQKKLWYKSGALTDCNQEITYFLRLWWKDIWAEIIESHCFLVDGYRTPISGQPQVKSRPNNGHVVPSRGHHLPGNVTMCSI
jgi:hypothetical protein